MLITGLINGIESVGYTSINSTPPCAHSPSAENRGAIVGTLHAKASAMVNPPKDHFRLSHHP